MSRVERERIEDLIVAAVGPRWVTPKELAPVVGLPWRVLMRAMLRLSMQGRIQGTLEYVKGNRCRMRPQRRYKALRADSTAMSEVLIPKPDLASLPVVGVRVNRVFEEEEAAPAYKVVLGARW